MILSQKQIEEIAAAVTRDFNEFFFGCETDKARIARATPIDQFATDYLSLDVSFARLSSDGSIYGLTAYENTEYIIEESNAQRSIALRRNQILLDESFIKPGQVRQLCGKRRFTLAHECAHQILFYLETDEVQDTCRKKYAARKAYSLRELKTHEDWNEARREFRELSLPGDTVSAFLDELCAGKFVYLWETDRDIYDSAVQGHLFISMSDGTTVELRLIEGGYVGYQGLGWYFVKMPGAVFDVVLAACR